MLGQEKKSSGIFLNIKEGAIVSRQDGKETHHSFVEGVVESINLTEREFAGEKVKYWYIRLHDDKSKETYLLGLHYDSGTFKSLVLQLASEQGLHALRSQRPIKIEAYLRDEHTKVQCHVGETRLSWVTRDLPPVEEVKVGEKVVRDDTNRMKFIEGYVDKLRDVLSFIG